MQIFEVDFKTVEPVLRAWVPIVISVFAVLISLWNRRTAKRALLFSERQEERRLLGLNYFLQESTSIEHRASGTRWIGIRLLVVNPADKDSSITTADLRLAYEAGGQTLIAKIAHSSAAPSTLFHKDQLAIPAAIPSSGAISGWLTFPLPKGMIGGPISSFAVVVLDSHGAEQSIDAWPIGRTAVVPE